MNKKITLFILIVFVALGVIVVIVLNTKETNAGKVKFIQKRNYTKSLSIIKSFETDKDFALMKKYDNHLYFASWVDSKVYKYDINNGKIVDTIGNRGEGPNENLLIMNYDIEDNLFLTIDARKGTIQAVDVANNNSVYYYKYPKNLSRSIKFNDKYLFTQSDQNQKMIFEKFDINTKEVEIVNIDETGLQNIEMSSLTHDGLFTKNNNFVIFATYASNKIYCFNKDLDYIFSIDMVYEFPEAKFITTKNGTIFPDENNINSIKSIFLDDKNNLYVISIIGDTGSYRGERVIDVYNMSSRKYSHSIRLSDIDGYLPYEIVVENENEIYVRFNEKFIVQAKFESL